MFLLQPLWLLAGLAVAVPVVIHLYHITKGRTVKVSSLLLLTASSPARNRSLKLSNLLLLLLRCLLLLLLAVLLAKPYVYNSGDEQIKNGLILMPPGHVQAAYNAHKPLIDSLVKLQYRFRFYKADYPLANLKDVLAHAKNDSLGPGQNNFWSLARGLLSVTAADSPVYIFATNKLKNYSGERPELDSKFKWVTFSPADTTATWLQRSFVNNNGSLTVTKANSTAKGTWYASEEINNASINERYKVNWVDGHPIISEKDNEQMPVSADTGALKLVVYENPSTNNSNYLIAAIKAISSYTGLPVTIKRALTSNDIGSGADWLFWLSVDSLDVQQKSEKVFLYQPGKETTGTSAFVAEPLPYFNNNIYRSVTATSTSAGDSIVWQNGYGEPVLVKDKNGIYRFYSRFSPQWTDVIWSSVFPQLLCDLLFVPHRVDTNAGDERLIANEQLLPRFVPQAEKPAKTMITDPASMETLLWFVALIFFLIERLISIHHNKISKG